MFKIIADDLGLHKLINDGIVFGLKNGLINGASLMPVGEEFDDAVSKVKNLDRSAVGIHFVLVDETPITLRVLPKNHKIFFIKYIFGLISLGDIEKELRAQLDKCITAGIKPVFINSHQHLHLLPGIMDIVVRLAVEHKIRYIRTVSEPISFSRGRIFRQIQLLFLIFLSKLAKNKIKKAGLECNKFFAGFINAGNLNGEDVKLAHNLIQEYPNETIEFGCHPGFENEQLREKYKNWGYNWQKELELLKNHKLS